MEQTDMQIRADDVLAKLASWRPFDAPHVILIGAQMRGKLVCVPCRTDTQAARTVFDREIGLALDLDLERCKLEQTDVAGILSNVRLAQVDLLLPKHGCVRTTVGFRESGALSRGYAVLGTLDQPHSPGATSTAERSWSPEELAHKLEEMVSSQTGSWASIRKMLPDLRKNPEYKGKTVVVCGRNVHRCYDGAVSALFLNREMKGCDDWAYAYIPEEQDHADW